MSDKKILIVDDLEGIREPLVRYLIKKGFPNVIDAGKANEALEKIEKEKPDLIILDIQLEESINGIEILRLTKSKLSPKSIVIMLSGHKDQYDEECKNLGAIEFWTKPLRPDVVLENIKRILST